MKAVLLLVAAALTLGSTNVKAADTNDSWFNRPNVIRVAQVLASEVEHFDESLHDTQAPADLIQLVHHFEETVTEFVGEVQNGAPYQHAMQEFNHIRADIGLIKQKLWQYPAVFQSPKVRQEWNHVWTSYRKLDHEMFVHLRSMSQAFVDSLNKAFAEVEASH